MTTKAMFVCENCGNEQEFSICSLCHGKIDFPHNPEPKCEKCGGKMHLKPETIRKVTE